MSEAFVLKYRPQKISELDLVDIREGLFKLAKSGKIPHALLFTGPRGTGKTSAARILAKVVNCLNRKKGEVEPCNHCTACQEITAGTALDLVEVDAASTRGIDDIRNLREKIKLAPAQLKSKFYIIDEVHMLTTEAFNALLKTLEEPPANTFFVLCTTDFEKLPATIVSRCTRFNFQKARPEEVVDSLKRVIKKEKLTIEKEAIDEIAKSVDGSFRDGQKILDQLSAGKDKITFKEAGKLLGKIEALSPEKLISFLVENELKKCLLEIERIVTAGADLMVYTQALLEKLRLSLLTKIGLEQKESFLAAQKLELEQMRFLIELFSKAAIQIKSHPIPQLPLELAVVEWCGKTGGDQIRESVFSETRAEIRNTGKTNGRSLSGPPNQTNGVKSDDSQTADQYSSKTTLSSVSQVKSLEEIEKRWQELLISIRPMNHSVEALLRAARPVKINGEVLTLEVFYPFHKERLEDDKCRSIFEEAATQLFSRPIKLKCILGERKVTVAQSPNQSGEDAVLEPNKAEDVFKTAEEIFGAKAN